MGEQPTPASDVYAIGALAWFGLTGTAPELPAERPQLGSVVPDHRCGWSVWSSGVCPPTPGRVRRPRPSPSSCTTRRWPSRCSSGTTPTRQRASPTASAPRPGLPLRPRRLGDGTGCRSGGPGGRPFGDPARPGRWCTGPRRGGPVLGRGSSRAEEPCPFVLARRTGVLAEAPRRPCEAHGRPRAAGRRPGAGGRRPRAAPPRRRAGGPARPRGKISGQGVRQYCWWCSSPWSWAVSPASGSTVTGVRRQIRSSWTAWAHRRRAAPRPPPPGRGILTRPQSPSHPPPRRRGAPPAARPPGRPRSVPSCGRRHGPCSSGSPTPGPGPTSRRRAAAGGGDVAGSPARASDERVIRGAVSAGATYAGCATSFARRRRPWPMGTGRPSARRSTRRRTRSWAATATHGPVGGTVGQPVSVTLRWTAGGWRIQQ